MLTSGESKIPTVTLSGPQLVEANTVAKYMLTIAGGQEAGGGFNVSTTNGSIDTLPKTTDTRTSNNEITHTQPKNVDDNQEVIFEFLWTAPNEAGEITLYAAGNSVNLDNNTSGDGASATTHTIQVTTDMYTVYLPNIRLANE